MIRTLILGVGLITSTPICPNNIQSTITILSQKIERQATLIRAEQDAPQPPQDGGALMLLRALNILVHMRNRRVFYIQDFSQRELQQALPTERDHILQEQRTYMAYYWKRYEKESAIMGNALVRTENILKQAKGEFESAQAPQRGRKRNAKQTYQHPLYNYAVYNQLASTIVQEALDEDHLHNPDKQLSDDTIAGYFRQHDQYMQEIEAELALVRQNKRQKTE